jgi:hypothetical protein
MMLYGAPLRIKTVKIYGEHCNIKALKFLEKTPELLFKIIADAAKNRGRYNLSKM